MKKLFFFLLLFVLFLTNINAEEIYSIKESSIYENNDYAFKYLFDDSHNLSVTVINTNKELSCQYQVEFLDDNQKLVYFNYYNSNINTVDKEYVIYGADFPRKNNATKYRIYTNCVDYEEESIPVDTDVLVEDDIFSVSKNQIFAIVIIGLIFDLLTIGFIVFILVTLIRKTRKNR